MKNLWRHLAISLAAIIICGLTFSAVAQEAEKHDHQKQENKGETKFLAKGDGITSCPVSGEKLESKTIFAEFYGRKVYFCCDDCLAAAKKNPDAYVKKTEAEQIEAVKNIAAKSNGHADHHAANNSEAKFLGKGDGVETCPVTGEKVNKSLKAEIQGHTVYVCCADCLEAVKKNPELYLKWAKKEDK